MKVSSRMTFLFKYLLPLTIIVTVIFLIFAINFMDFNKRIILNISLGCIIFSLGWILSGKNLERVDLHLNFFEVKKKKIPFENIQNIDYKIFSQIIIVKYKENGNRKSFMFIPSLRKLIQDNYVFKIKEIIRKK